MGSMRSIIKIALVLALIGIVLFVAQPLINKGNAPISNIEQIENIDGIRSVTAQSEEDRIILKILVENDLSEQEARIITEQAIESIDEKDKKITFSLLYEHGYLIGQGSLDVDNREIQWD